MKTTRSFSDGSPVGLWLVEDSMGQDAAVAIPVDAFPGRVIEIDGPEAWIDLCMRHPLHVTAARRHDWYRATGVAGGWMQPDWLTVAQEADGVHLTVAGYLATAGRALQVEPGWASVLAGWNPDSTYWFAGTSARPAGERRWRFVDDAWDSASDGA